MANILQVSPAPLNTEQQSTQQRIQGQTQAQTVQNPANPEAVNRADGQNAGQTGTATGESSYQLVDFEGNFAAFFRSLNQLPELSAQLSETLFGEGAMLLFQNSGELGGVLEELFSAIDMKSPEELLHFLKEQQQAQAPFSGSFFNGLRGLLRENVSESLRQSILEFAKTYSDFSAGSHLLSQMHTVSDKLGALMLPSFRGELEELLSHMDWGAEAGDTSENTLLLNNRIIPFLSNYISRTHDYGAVRDMTMLFILYTVKYENGSRELLEKQLNRLFKNGDFQLLFKGDPEALWRETLEGREETEKAREFARLFSSFLQAGTEGKAGAENIGKFRQVLEGLLVNESVYMPLMHLPLPFRYEGRDVMSELWIDPDSEKGREGSGRCLRLFLKLSIPALGDMELVMQMQERRVEMQLYLPGELLEEQKKIEGSLGEILRRNGLSFTRLSLHRRGRGLRLQEVFPRLRETGKGINLRV